MLSIPNISTTAGVSLRDLRLELGTRPFPEHLAAVRADAQERIEQARRTRERRRRDRDGFLMPSPVRPSGARGEIYDAVDELSGVDHAIFQGRQRLRRLEAAAVEGNLPRVLDLIESADQSLAEIPTLTWITRETLNMADRLASAESRQLRTLHQILKAVVNDDRLDAATAVGD